MKQRHHWLTGAATLIEIGIALSTVAIITRRRLFWLAPWAWARPEWRFSHSAYLG